MSAARRLWLAVVLLPFAWPAGAAGHDVHHGHEHTVAAKAAAPTEFQRRMNEGMATMMKDMHAPGYTGDADADFLAMMIPHHEGAVEMARLVLIHGRDPATRRLAEDIIASQQVEIEGMRRRLEQLKRGASHASPDGYPALGGTRGEAK